MKISAVITLYNLEDYIGDAIGSVLAQTRQPDEIIVADDCSTDRSAEIVAKYGERIRLIRQQTNVGALQNSLAGLKAATGDVVAFLDGDDVWLPQKLEAIEKEFLKGEDVVLVSHDFVRVDENLQEFNIPNDTRSNTQRITTSRAKQDWSKEMRDAILFRRGFWLGSAYAVKRTAIPLDRFEAALAKHPGVALSYLDMTLGPFVVAANPNSTVGFVNQVLFKYRTHRHSINDWRSITTIEHALRTIERWQSIHATTYRLIADVLIDKNLAKRYRNLHDELELVKLQFIGHKAKAIAKFVSLSPFLIQEKKIAHEFLRLLATTLCGPATFFRLKTRLARRAA
jgi:glycosyltransferase involved in cell wall biosynthesis